MAKQLQNITQTVKSNLLNPALTSAFYVEVPLPNSNEFKDYLSKNNINFNENQYKLNLLCSEASLPGSSLATHEVNNDFHGVTERYAYRRLYDDRLDLTFYVDAVNYFPIVFFETWIKFIVQESIAVRENGQPRGNGVGSRSPNYHYRMQYPDLYIADQGLRVNKFERSSFSGRGGGSGELIYSFVRSYPISINSMPVSYDSSSLLKCTVSMTYIRYVLEYSGQKPSNDYWGDNTGEATGVQNETKFNAFDPRNQAALNGLQLQGLNANLPNYNFNAASPVDVNTAFSSNLNLNLPT